jgi:hypothetical protein
VLRFRHTSPPSCRPPNFLLAVTALLLPSANAVSTANALRCTSLLQAHQLGNLPLLTHQLRLLHADPTGVPHLQDPQQHAEHGTPLPGEEAVQAASTGKRERKSGHKEAPKKIYFCAKPDCSHAFEGSIGRRPCYVQNGSFSKGQHKKACGGGYRWLEVRLRPAFFFRSQRAHSYDLGGPCNTQGAFEIPEFHELRVWLQLRDVEREPHVQLEQAGQQFFLNVTGPHTLEPRQGRAGHSPHMVRNRRPVSPAVAPPVALQSPVDPCETLQFRTPCAVGH